MRARSLSDSACAIIASFSPGALELCHPARRPVAEPGRRVPSKPRYACPVDSLGLSGAMAARRTTRERDSVRYVGSLAAGASSQGTMSAGESTAVSIHRRHGPATPVEPACLVVLTVRVVVPPLRAPHLVAHGDHGQTDRQHRGRQEVLRLAVSQLLPRRVVSGPFDPAVPAPVVVGTIAVVFPVRLVVLPIVGDEIVQGEAVVTGHEVDALFWLPPSVAVDLGAAEQAVGEASGRALLPPEEAACVVTEPSIPLLPAIAPEAAHLVEPRRIPRLGDELGAGQPGIRLNVPQYGRVGHDLARRVAGENRRQVKAKAVHVHRLHPVTKTVHDHAAYDRVISIERVPRARKVGVT